MTPPKRKRSLRDQLRIARAQLRALYRAGAQVGEHLGRPTNGPARFIQCWSVNRGVASVTQALDEEGVVWERRLLLEDQVIEGQKVKRVKESWWEKVSMERRPMP